MKNTYFSKILIISMVSFLFISSCAEDPNITNVITNDTNNYIELKWFGYEDRNDLTVLFRLSGIEQFSDIYQMPGGITGEECTSIRLYLDIVGDENDQKTITYRLTSDPDVTHLEIIDFFYFSGRNYVWEEVDE